MKKMKLIRLTGIALIVSLLLAILPVTAALAANNITLSKTTAAVGESITVEGTGFTPSTDDNARLANVYFAKDSANTFQAISGVDTRELVSGGQIGYQDEPDEGEFAATFAVPAVMDDGTDNENVVPGTYYIYVTVVSEESAGVEVIYAKTTFTVIGGTVTISPTSGKVDSTITLTGTDYVGSTTITVQFDTTAVAISSGSTTTSTTGTFSSTILVPDAIAGAHTISVTVGTTTKTATFTVTPGLIIAPQAGKAGDTITVSGTGFGRRASTLVYFNSVPVVTNPTGILTDTNGTFTATFTVPESLMTAGIYQVEGDDGVNVGTASFTLNVVQPTQTTTTTTTSTTTTTTTTPTTSTPVDTGKITVFTQDKFMIITGTGYTPGAPVSIKIDGVVIDSVTADANGAVQVPQFELSGLTGGDHEIVVSDGINDDSYTYTIESIAPGVPSTVAPKSGAKLKSPWTFEWNPVSDVTLPITYELQISSSQSFSTGTVLLDIKDIEIPMYELSEIQAANLVEQEAPYYYRIRAIDGASNQGTWSAAVSFYVSGSAGFPNWAIYTIAGVAGILLFGIGYLVGRRTAFYY